MDSVYYQFKNIREIIGHENANLSYAPPLGATYSRLRQIWDGLAENKAWYETDGFPLCRMLGHEHHSRELCDILRGRHYIGHEMRDGTYDHGTTFPGYEKPDSCARCSLDPICAGVFLHHCAVHGTEHLKPSNVDPAEIVGRSLQRTPMLMDEYCRHAGVERKDVEARLDHHVSKALAEIRQEHEGYWERKKKWEVSVRVKAEKAAYDNTDFDEQRSVRSKCLALLDHLAPEFDIESQCAPGWYLVDVENDKDLYTLRFTNRKQTLLVDLTPKDPNKNAHVHLEDLNLTYRIEEGANRAEKEVMKEILGRLVPVLNQTRPFQPQKAN